MTKDITKKNRNVSYYINCAIGLFFLFGFRFIPAPAPMNQVGMQVAGVFIGLIFMWSAIELIWPSILGIIAFGMTDYIDMGGAISAGLGSQILWQLMMIMMLAEIIKRSGVGEFIARWLITRKVLNGRPALFTFVLLWGFYIITPMIDCFTTVYLAWAIIYSLADILGYSRQDKYIKLLLMAAHLAAITGGGILPFQGWKLALCEAFGNTTGDPINYGVYIAISLTVGTLLMLLVTLSIRYVLKADMSPLKAFDVAQLQGEELKLNGRQKSYIASFVIIVLFVICSTMLPKHWPIVNLLNFVTASGIFGIVIAVLCMIKPKGKALMEFADIAEKGMNWNIIFVCSAAIPVASALTSETTGVRELLGNLLNPVFSGLNVFAFISIVIIAVLILTNIGSNIGVAMMLIPVVVPFVNQIGIAPAIIGIAIIFVANMGFILPGSSAMAPLLYSNEDIEVGAIYRYGLFYCLLFVIIAIPVFYAFSFII
ncbi:MAG: SLC13 family permease [Lachnospiraceae bacterium]